MKRAFFGCVITGLTLLGGACNSTGFGDVRGSRRLEVVLLNQEGRELSLLNQSEARKIVGEPMSRLPLTVNKPQPFRIRVRALDLNGNVDQSFDGWVRISSKPGAIEPINSPDAQGRSIRLRGGLSPDVEVRLTNAFGTTFLLADDLDYAPGNPVGTPPPACADGKDNDGDGLIDFPADPGCAFANDETESGGSFAQGASSPIFFQLPRIADARGVVCEEPLTSPPTCSGPGKTPYPKEQVAIDTGFHQKADGSFAFDFDLVVTRISSDGFFLTDTKDPRGAFTSAYVFNFNPPPNMKVCDRLKSFSGTMTEFFGLTQVSYPTWTLEEWDGPGAKRPCPVPEPTVLDVRDIPNDSGGGSGGRLAVPSTLLGRTASLVRVISDGTTKISVTPKFGPGLLPCKDASGATLDLDTCVKDPSSVFVPSVDAGTDCDLNKNGKIDFGTLPEGQLTAENRCSDACSNDPLCTEYSNFLARGSFRISVSDGNVTGAIQADSSAASDFRPLEVKGKPLKSFSGTLTYFSGGSQYTIEARCMDDIVVDPNALPLPAGRACVTPRQAKEDNPQ